ncbi:MAG TPA: phenylacetate--CoA ligase [Candidatus Omnitrophota bacterium]|nr:phenylacetate--CoA ligase [Candidatus Omnitrophota bacterium]HRZ14178.1 phenylacetate--CoA ligase [Candidatus Omnitrophota bacterium]
MKTSAFWDKKMETISRESLKKLQLARLKETVRFALKTPFYRTRLKKAGIASADAIKRWEDIKKIPFTTKDDLRECYPDGLLAVPLQDVVRVHTSSGTTGTPTVIYHTKADLDSWTDLVARSIVATGAGKQDIFQNMMSYGMFTGGLGLHYGAERVGMTVIPMGGGNTKRQIQLMKDFGTTVLHITPSYMLHVHSKLAEAGMEIKDLKLRKAYLGAEPYSENTRRKVEQLFHIDAYNSYGLSEMNGPGVAFECVEKKGMHVWEDVYIVEVIDPRTGESLPDEKEGELVFTNLTRRATPLLRYRTRDIACIHKGPCACKRTHRRISRITGRTDDMLIVNGVNVYPSQIEEVIMRIPQVGTNYMIRLEKEGTLDKLIVQVEIYSKMFRGDLNEIDRLKEKIREELRASIIIHPSVELHEPGSLPVFEGKAKRVVDNRQKL